MKKKKSLWDSVEAEVIHEAGDYVKEKVTKKAVKIGEMSAAFLFGFVLIIIGAAQFMASIFPYLENGINYLILGVFFFLIGMLLR